MNGQAEGRDKYSLTQGGILNRLLLVSLPIIGTQIIQMTYNLTDMFWLGRLSSEAVAASGSVGMYLWLSMALLIIGSKGAEIGVAQNLGRGDRDTARAIGQSAFTLALGLGVLAGAALMLARAPLIGFFGIIDSAVSNAAQDYLLIVSIGLPFSFVSAAVTGVFNGSGNSRTPFYINSIALVTNVALDPVLIFACGMGIAGAAVATVIAQAVGCVLLILALQFHKHRPFEKFRVFAVPSAEHMRQIFRWTLPMAAESFLFTFMSMFISRFIAAWGTDAMAAHRVGSQVESLSWLVAGGFSSALTAFIGQNYGARKWGRIHEGFRIASIVMVVYGAIITAVLFFGAQAVYTVFVPDNPNVVKIGVEGLKILAACQLVACLEGAAAGAFRGMGKTLPPSIASVSSNGLRVIAAYFLARTPLGLNGIWWAISIGAAVRSLWIYFWYRLSSRRLPSKDEAASDPEPDTVALPDPT